MSSSSQNVAFFSPDSRELFGICRWELLRLGCFVFFWVLVQAVRQFSIAISIWSEADALEASPSRHRRPRIFDDIFVGVFSDVWYTQNHLMVLMG